MPSELAHFYSRTRDARKVIVVDLGFLGDTIHLIPALWGLKAAYSKAELHVVTTPVGVEVLRLAACVDRAWAVEMRSEHRTLRQQLEVIGGLRREHFDVAYNFSGADRTLFLTALSGARNRVAYPGGRAHFWNSWLIPNWAPRLEADLPVFEQKRRTLAACGVAVGPARFDLQVDPEAAQWAGTIVSGQAMHVSVSSSKATREWPLKHHAELFRELWGRFPKLSIIASSSANARETKRLQELVAMVQDPRLQVIRETLTISQLAAVLQRCRLHLGPDSGVLHLAVALGRPTVSLFREQGAYRSFMPAGEPHQVISMPCHCVDNEHAPCEELGYGECFAGIQPGRVARMVAAVLEK